MKRCVFVVIKHSEMQTLAYLVVNVAVGEHGVEVLHALAGTAVEVIL